MTLVTRNYSAGLLSDREGGSDMHDSDVYTWRGAQRIYDIEHLRTAAGNASMIRQQQKHDSERSAVVFVRVTSWGGVDWDYVR